MTASYPQSIKNFTTVYDQGTYTPTSADPINPTIDFAIWTRELNEEVVAIENMIGSQPFDIPPSTDIAGSITQLYQNTAPVKHTHQHRYMEGLSWDGHPLYMTAWSINGSNNDLRGFSQPQVGVAGGDSRDLAVRSQVDSVSSVTTTQFNNQMNGWLSALAGAGHTQVTGFDVGHPLWDGRSFNGAYRIQGGVSTGYTDSNGVLTVYFNPPFNYQVQTLLWMRLPIPGGSHFGYVYQYMEDQLVGRTVDRTKFSILFIEDIAVDKRAWVNMSWIAIGI